MFSIDFQLMLLHVSCVTFCIFQNVMLKFGQNVAQCQKSAGLVIGDPLGVIHLPGVFIPEM